MLDQVDPKRRSCGRDSLCLVLWIERIAELPVAQQHGWLAEAITEADRHATYDSLDAADRSGCQF